ncbi:MAG: peptidylprolyl isomerase [Planctomycetes bacterium]|nr:peptidylprolyl isomerase [Planctomycetota bacterium]
MRGPFRPWRHPLWPAPAWAAGLFMMAWGFTAGMVGTACTQESKPVGSPMQTVWEAPAAESPTAAGTPTAQPAGSAAANQSVRPGAEARAAARTAHEQGPDESESAFAFVNGEPIGRGRLMDMLMESHGLAVLEQLILLTAARQKAASMSIVVTPADVTAAEDEALRRIAVPVGDPEAAPLDRPTAERLLADFLRLKGLSQVEWKCRMEQRAYLMKIAQADVGQREITEEMLRNEYGLRYGERVQIRHIQTAAQEAINRAAGLLKSKSFEEVAREMSENSLTREQGGLMPPFTRHDLAVPPLIRERAFAMSVGQVSEPLREGAWYHIIRVERKFPASGVGFENVDRDQLRQRLVSRLVRQRTDTLDAELFDAAKIDIRDRNLARQFRERHVQK